MTYRILIYRHSGVPSNGTGCKQFSAGYCTSLAIMSFEPSSVPEFPTMAVYVMLIAGLLGFVLLARRR